MLSSELIAQLKQRFEFTHADIRSVAGGDATRVYRLQIEDGRVYALKHAFGGYSAWLDAEAEGLSWLGRTKTVRVPKVVGCFKQLAEHNLGNEPVVAQSVLVSEWISERRLPLDDVDASVDQLGRELAALHRSSEPAFGFTHNNYIGALEQLNTLSSNWAEFYALRRLEPQVRLAVDKRLLDESMVQAFKVLINKLDKLVGPAEPPARLHGDLWNGNVLLDSKGRPVLIDPAVYAGHREMDLAMMRLFGGFPDRCFHAYNEVFRLAPGHEERVELYQLYPLLVHLNLFGKGYLSALRQALARYA